MSNNTDKAIAKYQVAVNKNVSEGEILWNRYNAILVFNTILITGIGISYQDNINLPFEVRLFLPISGLITCCLWGFMTYRGFRWIHKWIIFARDIEKEHLRDTNQNLNPISRGNKEKNKYFIKISNIEIGLTEIASYILILLTAAIYFLFILNISSTKVYTRQEKRIHIQYNNQNLKVRGHRFSF